MSPFREIHPVRTCTVQYANYRSYKEFLRKDFGKHCGYCSDPDQYCGGKNSFHIDHFKPSKHFKELKHVYSNLVYACSYCNIAKSDDWPCDDVQRTHKGGKGYVDPCDADFQNHFERHDNGRIKPKTDVGQYMFDQLKLSLRRHEVIWLIKKLYEKLLEVNELYKKHRHGPEANAIATKHMELFEEYAKYKGIYEEAI